MPRKPSIATQLRKTTSALCTAELLLERTQEERDSYRIRATKAEQEVAEWKKRFDALLAREPLPVGKGEDRG